MKNWIATTLIASALLGGATSVQAVSTIPALIVGEGVSTEAVVQAIDLKKRLITLRLEDGWNTTVKVGPEVRNFDQVKVGDRLKSEYSDTLTVKVRRTAGLRCTEVENKVDRAALGQKPAAVATRKVHFVAGVVKVDTQAGTITVTGAKGNSFEVKLKSAKVLGKIKVGDQVEGTFRQVVSIGVLPAAAKYGDA
ncbi:MAG: hypothetical protein IPN53_20825 [Comamonadaceae bacterium]|nr:hypothetical protein [Comamonadaceae bacterium]